MHPHRSLINCEPLHSCKRGCSCKGPITPRLDMLLVNGTSPIISSMVHPEECAAVFPRPPSRKHLTCHVRRQSLQKVSVISIKAPTERADGGIRMERTMATKKTTGRKTARTVRRTARKTARATRRTGRKVARAARRTGRKVIRATRTTGRKVARAARKTARKPTLPTA
jgi:hypothetical protein